MQWAPNVRQLEHPMNPILSAGLLIGILCGAWTFVMGFTGWYKDPALAKILFIGVAIAIEVAGLIWGLRRASGPSRATSRDGWRLAVGGWRLAVGDWRLAIGGWRLAVGGWRLAVGGWR
jgi:hypothetical protein